MHYSEAFRIPTAGISFGGLAMHNPSTGNATAVIVPYRNDNGATFPVCLQPGQILEIKFREVKSASAILTGLL